MSIQTVLFTPSICTYPSASNNLMRLTLPFPAVFSNQEIALSSALIYYSWRNITSLYGNNTVQYAYNGSTYAIIVPDGYYSISDINAYIQLQMFQNGHYLLDANNNPVYYISLQANPVYYSVTLTITPVPSVLPTGYTNPASMVLTGNTMQFIINNSKFGTLIGFLPASYPSFVQSITFQRNSNTTAIISPTTSVSINCSLISDSKFNRFPQTISVFSPNVSYTQQIYLEPQNLLWYKVLDSTVQYIDVFLTDQDGNPIQVLDKNMVFSLIVRDRQTR